MGVHVVLTLGGEREREREKDVYLVQYDIQYVENVNNTLCE